MRFQYEGFEPVPLDVELEFQAISFSVRGAERVSVLVSRGGELIPVWTGFETNVELSSPLVLVFRSTAEVVVASGRRPVQSSGGPVFTNVDRMPVESEHVLAVKRAMREFHLEQRETLRAIRSERYQAQREAARRQESEPAPVEPAESSGDVGEAAPDSAPSPDPGVVS